MKWKWYHAVRLKKLADFLCQLENEQFDFGDWVTEEKNDCGTVCCALGWMPAVDKRWEWRKECSGTWRHKLKPYCNTVFPTDLYAQAQDYFGLTHQEYYGLFIPFSQKHYIGYKDLNVGTTPKQIARMYYRFIARKEKVRLANKK